MDANLQLSAEEMRLVIDPDIILTKNSIIRKVVEMFAALSAEWRGLAPDGVAPASEAPAGEVPAGEAPASEAPAAWEPKISKGENYKGLPWVMLDYPRVFGKEDVLAIRTMFWWGHAFSMTLHLKGKYMRLFVPVILRRREELAAAGFRAGISEEEWEHAHTEATYRSLAEEIPDGQSFFKLSARCGLEQWNEAPEVLTQFFIALLRVIRER
jgi:hypothetical protein